MKALRILRTAAVAAALALIFTGSASARKWVTTWATAQQIAEPHNNPPIPLAGETLRQIVQVSIGGNEIRLRFSNRFSQEDLEMFRRFWPEGIARFLARRYAGSEKSNEV